MTSPPIPSRPSDHRSHVLAHRATEMRHAPTTSEARLFEALRCSQLGVAFRRQVPVLGRFIVDLLAPDLLLVVEVDGGYHSRRVRADARRDRALARAGYHVVRIDAELVMGDLETAVTVVRDSIDRLRLLTE